MEPNEIRMMPNDLKRSDGRSNAIAATLRGNSYWLSAAWFMAGGLLTAAFSGSLVRLTTKAGFAEVLAVGMLVPSFTWVVQLGLATIGLAGKARRVYVGALARVCLLGSFALLPAAIVNWCAANPPGWISVTNVLLSAALMGGELFRRTARSGLSPAWPTSWCLTISLNMALFLFASRAWW
jgi:hypothetical protein